MNITWAESYQLLLQGDYDNGFPQHEIIPVQTGNQVSNASTYGLPVWQGEREPITLLVNAEFGDGDTIQYYRFIELAKERVSKVILRCNGDFQSLFSDVVSTDSAIPPADKIIHMMALPKALGIKKKDMNGKAYLKPNFEVAPCKEIQALSLFKMKKFGINWAGNPFNPRDSIRSIPVELFKKIEGAKFFSLNKLYEPLEGYLDCRGIMADWNETAHLVSLFDLVITVETSIACLAGALGVPVWVLVPTEDPEYRWGLEGETTLWYDSMKLYRKRVTWEDTLDLVARDFKALLNSFQSSGLVCAPTAGIV